jgi:ribonuclease D
MHPGAVEKLGASILEALKSAVDLPSEGVVQRLEGRPDPEERSRQKRLSEAAKATAGAVGIAPEILATQRDLKRLLRGEPVENVFAGWRLSLLAEPLSALLRS